MDPKKIALNAVVTFFQVLLSVLLGTAVMDWTVESGEIAVASAAGAGLSVIYNGLSQWKAKLDAE